jgi:hypothetical protein
MKGLADGQNCDYSWSQSFLFTTFEYVEAAFLPQKKLWQQMALCTITPLLSGAESVCP